jgi:hypothetical protein
VPELGASPELNTLREEEGEGEEEEAGRVVAERTVIADLGPPEQAGCFPLYLSPCLLLLC